MNPLLLSPILEFGKALLGRFFPDPEKAREAELEMFRMAQAGELQQVLAQLEINAREAANPSVFVSGGRPLFLWVGGIGFAYATILKPFFDWYCTLKGLPILPDVNTDLLWCVVTGMLGISGMRSLEKNKGTAK